MVRLWTGLDNSRQSSRSSVRCAADQVCTHHDARRRAMSLHCQIMRDPDRSGHGQRGASRRPLMPDAPDTAAWVEAV